MKITIDKTNRKVKQKELVAKTIESLKKIASRGERKLIIQYSEFLHCYDKSWAFADDVKKNNRRFCACKLW